MYPSHPNLLFANPYPHGSWEVDPVTHNVAYTVSPRFTHLRKGNLVVAHRPDSGKHAKGPKPGTVSVKRAGTTVPTCLSLAPIGCAGDGVPQAATTSPRPAAAGGPLIVKTGLNTISCMRPTSSQGSRAASRCASAAASRSAKDGARLLSHAAETLQLPGKPLRKRRAAAATPTPATFCMALAPHGHDYPAEPQGCGEVDAPLTPAAAALSQLYAFVSSVARDASPYEGHAVMGAFKTVLAYTFEGWSREDGHAVSAFEGSGYAFGSRLRRFKTYRERCEGLKQQANAKADPGNFVGAFQNFLAKKVSSSIRGKTLAVLVFRSWHAYAVRTRNLRKATIEKLMRSRGRELMRACFSDWRKVVTQTTISHAKETDTMLRENLTQRMIVEKNLVTQAAEMRHAMDRLHDANRYLRGKVAVLDSCPSIIDLRKPLHDGCPDDPDIIKHGIIEFRHFTEDEQEALSQAILQEREGREEDVRVLEDLSPKGPRRGGRPARAVSKGATQLVSSFSDDFQDLHEARSLVSHPYAPAYDRLQRDVKRLPFPVGKGQYYVPLAIRGITASEEDAAVNKGGGFVNRREFVLTWANLAVTSVLHPGEVAMPGIFFAAFDKSFCECKALLMLLHVIAPYGAASGLGVAAIVQMEPHARREVVADMLSHIGIYTREEAAACITETDFNEDFYHLLLCQLYVYDHLNGKARHQCAQLVRRHTGVDMQRASSRTGSMSTASLQEYRRMSTRVLGMLPRSTSVMSSDAGSPAVTRSGSEAGHLGFHPSVGLRKLDRVEVQSTATQCNLAVGPADPGYLSPDGTTGIIVSNSMGSFPVIDAPPVPVVQ